MQQIKRYKSQFFPKKIGSLRSQLLTSEIFFQFLLLIYNSRTIVIISFLSQEYLQVFMYIMCFNVSICFKMGSLYSYCDIITELVYPPELSRSAGFCTNSKKKFSGGGPPHPPFQQNCLRLYYNHNTANHLKN